jgi:hypothetical protein
MTAARPLSRTLGLAALLAVAAAGCDPPPPPAGHDLSGRVTFDGQDVKSGEIYFTPEGGASKSELQMSFVITDGRYTTAYTRRSAPVGPAKVRMNFLVDEQLYSYETTTDLPPSPGTKDFAIARKDAQKVPKLPTPGGGGGAAPGEGGKGKGKGKGRDRSKDVKDSKDPAKGVSADDKKTQDTKKTDEKKEGDQSRDGKPGNDPKPVQKQS